MKTTVLDIVKDDLCTGCGTCAAICPKDAIDIIIDKKKYVYMPQLKEGKCTYCGICYNVCPGRDVNHKDLNMEIFGKEPENYLIGNYISCYTGYSLSHDIRYNSSSGGLVTTLLVYILEKGLVDGVLVTRMKKNKPLEPEPFIARTKDEIIDASKSKYCPVPVNIILREIINTKDGEKFAIVGLPCHIQGLKKAQKINSKLRNRITLCLGLFCAHTDNFLATEFILNRFGIKKENVKRIEYRGRGWPGSMLVKLNDGNIKFILFKDYIKIFHSYNFFTPKRCLLCNDATCELADISFGDAWSLPGIKNSEVGFSILTSRTKHGEDILLDMKNSKEIELIDTTAKNIIMSQRGLIYTKKIGFKLRMDILSMTGKKLPNFNIYIPRNDFISLDTMLPYINTYISMNGAILWLFRYIPNKIIYCYGSISNGMAYLWLIFWLYKQKGD